MVQKSHTQPPGMYPKPVVKNGISATNLNWWVCRISEPSKKGLSSEKFADRTWDVVNNWYDGSLSTYLEVPGNLWMVTKHQAHGSLQLTSKQYPQPTSPFGPNRDDIILWNKKIPSAPNTFCLVRCFFGTRLTHSVKPRSEHKGFINFWDINP